jgi:glucose-6-phosphate isomerase
LVDVAQSTQFDGWRRYQEFLCTVSELNLTLDISRMGFPSDFLERMEPEIQRAYAAMQQLEQGAIANPDENRMVGHYWLRAPKLAPTPQITREIEETFVRVERFAVDIHESRIKPPMAACFTRVLSIGIGGSALGPMFVADALSHPATDKMEVHFLDNTDPDGFDRVLASLEGKLRETLTIVTSKSGGTPETHNGMKVISEAYSRAGLAFSSHAVAITMPGSELDRLARDEAWVARFPMLDWVGGRTSETSAVGLLPAALQGLDINALSAGAAACDEATRVRVTPRNPAALLALMWHHATQGKGLKDMVVLPYKDRLLLFSRYLQQLVMESLGKRLDLAGNRVDQGLTVYGNKGSTDQHAYVQQLRDGVNNFFVTFIRVLEAGKDAVEVSPGIRSGDYLHGFLLGTREALSGNGRESITITVPRVDARTVGALIALFERAVGFYATLINVNAYHQPGVQAGKDAAGKTLALQRAILERLTDAPQTAVELAQAAGFANDVETVYLILEHLTANGRARMAQMGDPSSTTFVTP